MKRYETYKIDAANTKTTPQGFLEVRAYTARTGVQKYKKKDGTYLREYRPEQEVFTDKNIEALKTSPVTNGHPPEMVTPENSKRYMVGFPTKGVRKIDNDGPEKYLETWLTITDKDAIAAIKAGKAEVSNGYSVELDWTPGLYKGENYDAVQRKIVNNHIAIVWHARAGGNVRLHLDAEDAIVADDEVLDMDTINIDSVLDMDEMVWRFGGKRKDLLRSLKFRKKLLKARKTGRSRAKLVGQIQALPSRYMPPSDALKRARELNMLEKREKRITKLLNRQKRHKLQ